MTREKSDRDNRRVIVDLRWPRGASVNFFTRDNVYLNTVKTLKSRTVDNITDKFRSVGSNACQS